MEAPARTNAEINAIIRKEYPHCETPEDARRLADKLGIKVKLMQGRAHRMKVSMMDQIRKKPLDMSEAINQRIKAEYMSAKSVAELAGKLGMSAPAVTERARRMGLSRSAGRRVKPPAPKICPVYQRELDDALLREYETCKNPNLLRERLGISEELMNRRVKALKLNRLPAQLGLDADDMVLIRALLREGLAVNEIAVKFEVPAQYMHRILKWDT